MFTFKNKAKFIFACNRLPQSFDPSYALARRLNVIQFNERFSGDRINRFIVEEIAEEMSGVLNCIIGAYVELKKKSFSFTHVSSSKKIVSEFIEESDNDRTVYHWYNLYCEDLPPNEQNVYYSLESIYASYKRYFQDNYSRRELNQILNYLAFSKKLTEKYPWIKRRRVMKDGKKHTCLTGFKTSDEYIEIIE